MQRRTARIDDNSRTPLELPALFALIARHNFDLTIVTCDPLHPTPLDTLLLNHPNYLTYRQNDIMKMVSEQFSTVYRRDYSESLHTFDSRRISLLISRVWTPVKSVSHMN